ncbi:hypothetical protein JIN85_08255 [Luteolibacter pohnpeiensis]|uniref:Uncharacterized protein n=1 Tax=Luteolibacter pohnpeiensis TaxID=454153 RepID=A0A934S5T7_9BACT|nr:hypothetical protein [Luteolibacter pohnpeiensis]MBK1882403.1 hypothetical protein [Luteolibacter pohnpeiensis]
MPAGVHEVSWSANQAYKDFLTSHGLRPATTPTQAWVGDLRIENAESRYQRVMEESGIPIEQTAVNQDADGDGFSNLQEYAFGSDANDRSSLPPPIFGESASYDYLILTDIGIAEPGDAGVYHLWIPYISPFVNGSLETSTDLIHWSVVPITLLNAKPSLNIVVIPNLPHTDTHQAIQRPVDEDEPCRYFRVNLSLPES